MNQKTRRFNAKKAISIAMVTLAVVIFILAIYIFAGAMIARKNHQPYQYFGYSLHVIATDSMTPEYTIGDMVFVKSCDIAEVKVGDNVLFKSLDPALKGNNIIHQVLEVKVDNGHVALVTSGTREGATADTELVTEIFGVARGSNAFFGKIFIMLTTPSGLIALCVLMVGVALVCKCVKNIVKSVRKAAAKTNAENGGGSEDSGGSGE